MQTHKYLDRSSLYMLLKSCPVTKVITNLGTKGNTCILINLNISGMKKNHKDARTSF